MVFFLHRDKVLTCPHKHRKVQVKVRKSYSLKVVGSCRLEIGTLTLSDKEFPVKGPSILDLQTVSGKFPLPGTNGL